MGFSVLDPKRLARELADLKASIPGRLEKLNDLQLQLLLQQLNKLTTGLGGAQSLPTSPYDFGLKYRPRECRPAEHLRFLSDQLVRLEQRKIRKLVVSMPPRHGKSWTISYFFPVWYLARHPRDRVILAGYGEFFAKEWGARVRDSILEHGDDLNLQVHPDKTAANNWELTAGGGMICVGVGGSLVGRGANVLVIDDPIKNEEESYSQVYRDKMWEWWQATAFTRLEPNGVVCVVATRWHEDDLIGRILSNDADSEWEILNLPALAGDEDQLGRKLGEPLWPEHFPDDPDYAKRQGSLSPYWWSAQFQGRPTPEGGGILKREWFQFYHTLPETLDQMIQSWDLSLKDKETSDYSVGQVWARKGADLFLVNQVRGHFSMDRVIHHMKSFMTQYPKAAAKLVEDSAMGPILKQSLQHDVGGIIPIPARGSKRSRAEAAVPFLQGHNVYLPESQTGTKSRWVQEFWEECGAFPKGVHDDQVDAFTQAVAFLIPGGWRDLKKASEAAKQEELTPARVRKELLERHLQKRLKRFTERINNRERDLLIGGPKRRLW